jgi:hypothetical protein
VTSYRFFLPGPSFKQKSPPIALLLDNAAGHFQGIGSENTHIEREKQLAYFAHFAF